MSWLDATGLMLGYSECASLFERLHCPHREVLVAEPRDIDGSWKIVECHCFNVSRFSVADVPCIVTAVSAYQERHWVRERYHQQGFE